jgi:hypothetical protein
MSAPTDRDRESASESERERTQRQLIELLQELRVIITGVQVLFAFLLAVPFNQRFASVTSFQKDLYLAILLLTALSTALLMAPTAYHRIRFHQRDRVHIIEVSNRFALAGLATLALAMTGAVLLVTDFLFADTLLVVVTTAGTAIVFATLWYGVPLARRASDEG